MGSELADELFEGRRKPVKERLSRNQKRENRRKFQKTTTEDGEEKWKDLDFRERELQELQEKDETLENVRKREKGDPHFLRKCSLIYRRSLLENEGTMQLVLPQQCREAVLKLAHEAPIAGHKGRNKTIKRILRRFYWPSIYGDVAEYCRRCPECQMAG